MTTDAELTALISAELRLQHDGLVTDVCDNVHSISTASSEIASSNHDLSSRTEQTASSLEETAASMEQLTATVGQAADTTRQATHLAGNVAQAAQRGGSVVESVVGSMSRISESAHRISDIIGVIDSIAFQTNILALIGTSVDAAQESAGQVMEDIVSSVRKVSDMIGEISASWTEQRDQAQSLSGRVAMFKVGAGGSLPRTESLAALPA